MKYYVKKSDVNNVIEIIAYEGNTNHDWFIEVKKPTKKVLEGLKSITDGLSPYVVENGTVVEKQSRATKIKAIKGHEEEAAAIGDVDIMQIIEELAEFIGKLPGNKLNVFEKYKKKKDKQNKIAQLLDELKEEAAQ